VTAAASRTGTAAPTQGAPRLVREGENGRNRVSQRALRRMAEVIAAEELGVRPGDVSIELADDGGLLGVTASLPISLPSLASADRGGARVAKPRTARLRTTERRTTEPGSSDGTVLGRAAAAQSAVRDRMLHLTGSTVGAVNLRLTAARTEGGERR
jgi:hypothetical protein